VTRGRGIPRQNYDRSVYFTNTNPGKYGRHAEPQTSQGKGPAATDASRPPHHAICGFTSPGQRTSGSSATRTCAKVRRASSNTDHRAWASAGRLQKAIQIWSYGTASPDDFYPGCPNRIRPAGWGIIFDHSPGLLRRDHADGRDFAANAEWPRMLHHMSQCETASRGFGNLIVEPSVTGKRRPPMENALQFRDWSRHGAVRCAGGDNG